tara:strand:- start:828 stop:1790 length:963 start_codon:yes stop_codon:yes gene_type:complete
MIHFLIIAIVSFPLIFGKEIKVQEIQLSGLITDKKQEISGMDWYQDRLFLLPENMGGFLFSISKGEILDAIVGGKKVPITPKKTRFKTPDYSSLIKGFDGFEAIAFSEDKIYISIEAERDGEMIAYLAWGEIDSKSLEVNISEDHIVPMNTPIQLGNMSFESLLIDNNNILMIYEANGSNLRKDARQTVFSPENKITSHINFPNIEYRITDVTRKDNNGRFWAINYFWPGDKKLLSPGEDNVLNKVKQGSTHSKSNQIERLIEFEMSAGGISISDTKPIQLFLESDESRNWEAIARLGNRGLLIATDKHPRMILGYVQFK